VEAVFIALHGEFGEDGQVQSELDARGVPYTGSGARASRLAFDKVETKRVLVEHGICTPPYEVLHRGETRRMALPVVVKPARQGSTIGVHRVTEEAAWPSAFEDALRYGPAAVVEACIAGHELTVGILGDEALPVIEIVAPDDWYGYDAKYVSGQTRYLVPAPVGGDCCRRCQDLALETFEALGCRGFARVDFRCSGDGVPHVLELNSIPGFTSTSLVPKAAAARGIGFAELCDRIMDAAQTGE
jgi:D-alanine-D-alanine ligase